MAEDRLPAGEDAWDAVDNIVTLTVGASVPPSTFSRPSCGDKREVRFSS
jgi:hypothetical protein